jgi:hypothetical protein
VAGVITPWIAGPDSKFLRRIALRCPVLSLFRIHPFEGPAAGFCREETSPCSGKELADDAS